MPAASEPLTPAITALKLSKVPSAISRAVPPLGASAFTYSKCLNPAGYFRSPNNDTPCRQFLSSANAAPIERDHVSGRAASGHPAAEPTITLMKSRRRIALPKAGTTPTRTRLQQGFAIGGIGFRGQFARYES